MQFCKNQLNNYMIGISQIIQGAIAPVSNIITKLITRKEDRALAEAEIQKIQVDLEKKIIDYQTNTLNAQKEILVAEIKGSAMQRNWRPALMWVIILIIANNYLLAPVLNNIIALFGPADLLPVLELPDKLFNLMTIGLGGYVVGRTAEKVIPQYAEMTSKAPKAVLEEKVQKEEIKKSLQQKRKEFRPFPGPKF